MSLTLAQKAEQQKQMIKLSQSLPDGLPKPPSDQVDFASNYRKLNQLREKALLSDDSNQRLRAKENQKKFNNIVLENFKKALSDVDRMHTKAVVELKHIVEKIEVLKKIREVKD